MMQICTQIRHSWSRRKWTPHFSKRMHILPISFGLLTYTGYWRPIHWPVNSVKYWIYNIYTSFMFTLLQSFVFYGLVDTFLSSSLQEFVDKLYLFLSVFGVSIKLIHLFIRRRRIIGLDKMLLKENCIPRDSDEALIRQKFERNAKYVCSLNIMAVESI